MVGDDVRDAGREQGAGKIAEEREGAHHDADEADGLLASSELAFELLGEPFNTAQDLIRGVKDFAFQGCRGVMAFSIVGGGKNTG